jgi:hypothetical protein
VLALDLRPPHLRLAEAVATGARDSYEALMADVDRRFAAENMPTRTDLQRTAVNTIESYTGVDLGANDAGEGINLNRTADQAQDKIEYEGEQLLDAAKDDATDRALDAAHKAAMLGGAALLAYLLWSR